MFGSKIKNRVTKVLNERIARAEAKHVEVAQGYKDLFASQVEAAKISRDTAIESHATQMVESIIGKVS